MAGKLVPSSRKQTIIWDEPTIAEHDKERGTRQKIDEPPTPFRYDSSDRDGEGGDRGSFTSGGAAEGVMDTSWETIQAKLQYEKSLEEQVGKEAPDSPPQDSEKSAFKSKRAAHYNEFKVIQAMRNAHDSDEEGDTRKPALTTEGGK